MDKDADPNMFSEGWQNAHQRELQVDIRGSKMSPTKSGERTHCLIGVDPSSEKEVEIYIASHGDGSMKADPKWNLDTRLTIEPDRVTIEIWDKNEVLLLKQTVKSYSKPQVVPSDNDA